jgi:hypothetical protein
VGTIEMGGASTQVTAQLLQPPAPDAASQQWLYVRSSPPRPESDAQTETELEKERQREAERREEERVGGRCEAARADAAMGGRVTRRLIARQ